MNTNQPHRDLINHLTRTSQLTPAQASRLVDEVITYFSEPLDQFVQRRHQELQESGYKNPDIFTIIKQELSQTRFPSALLSDRQLRRLVYG